MVDDNSEKSNKIEKIYRIIEFEIENANNQISLYKKDNINFILLFFALIGLFVFIPADTFFYKWFVSGIWATIILMGIIAVTSIFIYLCAFKGKFKNKNALNGRNNKRCEFCESSTICKDIDDSERKQFSQNYLNSTFIENIGIFYSAFIYTSFFFLLSCMVPYLYFTASNDVTPSFQNNAWISILLMFILLLFILLYYRNSSLLEKKNLKKYLSRITIYSTAIPIFTLIIAIYGIYYQIPPYIAITDESQFSPLLVEHIKIIPSMPLSWIVAFYTIFICLVLLEFFVASKYIIILNKKLEELLILKYRIDRYQLGISPQLNIENIIIEVSKLKIEPPCYVAAGGIFTIPFPLPPGRCEEMAYLSILEQPTEEKEDIQN